MKNMVKNAYTAYRIDNSTDYGNYLSITGCKFSKNILSFDMWLYLDDGVGEIVSQTDVFSIRISQDKVLIEISGKNTLTIRSDVLGIPKKQWFDLYFGYDGKTIKILINGNTIGNVDCSGKITNNNELMIGREFTGYIRSFRIYTTVLDEDAFRKYFMAAEYSSSEMKEIAAFIDCTQKNITELCGSDISVNVNGSCLYMDLVDVYCPKQGGFTYFNEPDAVNPGGFDTNQFSIYIKFYVRPSRDGRQILYINGQWNNKDVLALLSDKQNGKTKFIFMIGANEYHLDVEIPDYTWVDVLVSSSDKKLAVYVNGQKQTFSLSTFSQRKQEGSFKIGGCQNASDMTSMHYIHTVAVFDKELGDSDASAFLTDHPFVFEDGLVALVSFEGGNALELVGGLSITAGETGLYPAQHTVDELPSESYNFRLNYTKPAASEMKKWKAEQVIAGYKEFAVKMGGFNVTASSDILEILAIYLSNHNNLLQKSGKLYSKPKIQSTDAVNAIDNTNSGLIKAMLQALKLTVSGTAAAAAAAMVGSAAVNLSAYKYAVIFAIGCAVAAAAAAGIVAAVNDIHKDKPDDDDDTSDVTVKLLSITFQHTPDSYDCSAVRCRNYQGTINGPEWTYGEKCKVPALYIADRVKKAKIKFGFKIIDNSPKKASSYAISFSVNVFSGENSLFDNLTYMGKDLEAGTEYDVFAESGITASIKKTISYSQIKLWWSCDVNGTELCLPNTTSEIYILPQIPDSPIFLQKGYDSYFPAIEFLEIYTQMLSDKIQENDEMLIGVDENSIKYIANVIFHTSFFKYQGVATTRYVAERYDPSTRVSTFVFKERNFFYDVNQYIDHKREALLIECEVYASLLAYYLHLFNVGFNVVMIKNPYVEGQVREQLITNPVYAAGSVSEGPSVRRFDYHVVIEIYSINDALITPAIYDCSLGLMNEGTVHPIVGLAYNGEYKNAVFQANSTVTRFNDIEFAFAIDPDTFDTE